MSTFNEADHPRHGDGKWATKELGETDPGFGEDLDAAVAAAATLDQGALADAALNTKAMSGDLTWEDLEGRFGKMTEERVRAWDSNNFDPASARDWMSAGFDADDAYKWSEHFSAETAGRWRAAGFDADDARRWERSDFTPDQASTWADAGFYPGAAQRWTMRGFDAASAREWADGNFDPMHAQAWRSSGLEPTGVWAETRLELGVTPEDALQWRDTGKPPAEIQKRIDIVTKRDGTSPLDRVRNRD